MDKIESTQLFQYIKSFCDGKYYMNLMNTSKGMFHEIKRETIIYTIRSYPLNHWGFFKITKLVKDPKKQITIDFSSWSNSLHANELGVIGCISHSLAKVDIWTGSAQFSNDFDFSIFNNIPVVSLQGFNQVTKIVDGLQNIQELSISFSDLESIYDFNVTKSLHRLEIEECTRLETIPWQKEENIISKIARNSRGDQLPMVFTKLNYPCIDMNQLFTRHLESIHLIIPAGVQLKQHEIDLLGFVKKLVLTTQNIEGSLTYVQPFLSFFGGLQLEIDDFVISQWSENFMMPEIKTFSGRLCKFPTTLPPMPKVKALDLQVVEGLEIIQTFPNLTSLACVDVTHLVRIDNQPRLTWFCVEECPKIRSLHSFQSSPVIKTVTLMNCDLLEDMSPFIFSSSIEIAGCKFPISDLTVMSGVIPPFTRSKWTIKRKESLETCRVLSNIKALTLESITTTSFENLQIFNIMELKIRLCPDLITTKNISDIKESLVLEQCTNLVALENLQGIPCVSLCSLRRVKDFSGLGHHDQLFIFRTPYVAKLARWYAEMVKKGTSSFHPFHEIFSTIRSCTICKLEKFEPDDCYNDYVYDYNSINNSSCNEKLW